MPIIELQIKTSAFLTMQRNVLRNLAICPPALPAVFGVQIVMDRIEFGNSSLRHNKAGHFSTFYINEGEVVPTPYQPEGFQTQLAQNVTVYLTSLASILAHPNAAPTLVPFAATLVYDLDFRPFETNCAPFDPACEQVEHECNLVAQISAIEWGPLPFLPPDFSPLKTLPTDIQDQLKSFMMQQLRLFAPGGVAPVGLNALPKQMRFVNAGMSVDAQLQFIAIRVQIGGGNDNADRPWTDFYRGAINDRLQGNDFAFFIESTLLTEKIKAEIDTNLPTNDNLEAYPNCTYSHSIGKAILTIDVLLIYHLYRNSYLDLDIKAEADPRVAIELTIAHPNELIVDFDFSHLLDSDDPLVNFAFTFINTLGIPLQEMLLVIAGNYLLPELKKNVSPNCKKISDTHMQCSRSISTPLAPGSLQTTLTKLVTFDSGLAFAGTINVKDLTPAVISTAVRQFKITVPTVTCGPAGIELVALFKKDPTGFGVLTARGFVQNTGTAPMRLCNAPVVLRGADGPFPLQNIKPDGNMAPFDIAINLAAPAPGYYAAAYPLDLLVKTSGGTRLLRFNPPPVITDVDFNKLATELLVEIGNCEKLVDEWARLHSGYNPRWSPRPPEKAVVEHQWEVVITGLKAGEKVALVDSNNRQVAVAVSSGIPVRLMAVVPPAGENELFIKHVARHSAVAAIESIFRDTNDKQHDVKITGLEVRQTLLTHRGAMPVRGRIQNLLAANIGNRQGVAAVLENSIVLYDFSNQQMPVAVRSWEVAGVRGAVNRQGMLLAYGDEGMEWLYYRGNGVKRRQMGGCTPVRDVTTDGKNFYAISSQGLHIYSNNSCSTASFKFDHERCIVTVGDKLIIGGKEGITIADKSDLKCSHKHMSDLDIKSLRLAFANEPGLFVAELTDGTARAFRLHENTPEIVSAYDDLPWHTNAVVLGDLVLKVAKDSSIVDLYTVGQTEFS